MTLLMHSSTPRTRYQHSMTYITCRLGGVMVDSRVADLGSNPVFICGVFGGRVQWPPCQVPGVIGSAPGKVGPVSILWLGEIASLICHFCLSVAARTIVWADPFLRYTSMCWDVTQEVNDNNVRALTSRHKLMAKRQVDSSVHNMVMTGGPAQPFTFTAPADASWTLTRDNRLPHLLHKRRLLCGGADGTLCSQLVNRTGPPGKVKPCMYELSCVYCPPPPPPSLPTLPTPLQSVRPFDKLYVAYMTGASSVTFTNAFFLFENYSICTLAECKTERKSVCSWNNRARLSKLRLPLSSLDVRDEVPI